MKGQEELLSHEMLYLQLTLVHHLVSTSSEKTGDDEDYYFTEKIQKRQ